MVEKNIFADDWKGLALHLNHKICAECKIKDPTFTHDEKLACENCRQRLSIKYLLDKDRENDVFWTETRKRSAKVLVDIQNTVKEIEKLDEHWEEFMIGHEQWQKEIAELKRKME